MYLSWSLICICDAYSNQGQSCVHLATQKGISNVNGVRVLVFLSLVIICFAKFHLETLPVSYAPERYHSMANLMWWTRSKRFTWYLILPLICYYSGINVLFWLSRNRLSCKVVGRTSYFLVPKLLLKWWWSVACESWEL